MKIFSFDAETNGLWGQPFALAAVVYEDGREADRFVARCPITGDVNPWVQDNVLPRMEDVPMTHVSLDAMYVDFAAFWLKHKEDAACLVHMGQVVEADIFRTLHTMELLGDWDAPYLWYDVCVVPGIGDSVDKYCAANNLPMPTVVGGTHNPLYDALVTATAYFHAVDK